MAPILLALLVGFTVGVLVGLGWWKMSLLFLVVALIAAGVGLIHRCYLTARDYGRRLF